MNNIKILSKIADDKCPVYLETILLKKVEAVRPNSRYANNFHILKWTTTFKRSLIPSTIKMWDDLPLEARNIYLVNLVSMHPAKVNTRARMSPVNIASADLWHLQSARHQPVSCCGYSKDCSYH